MASATPRTQRPVAIVAGGSTGIGASVSRLTWTAYEPVPARITGMGAASSIAPSDRLAADLAGAHRGSTP